MSYSRDSKIDGEPSFHEPCLAKRRSEETSQFGYWKWPPRPPGQLPTGEEVANSFAMTVRYAQGESAGRLAEEFGLTIQGRLRRIDRFENRLPTDDRANKYLRRWSRLIRWGLVRRKKNGADLELAGELVLDPSLPLREQLRLCLSGGPKLVDQLEKDTGKPRKLIMNMLNIHQGKDFIRLPSDHSNRLWGLLTS